MVCDDQRVRVKVNGGDPIPTTHAETSVSTDSQKKSAAITRLSEVKLPTEWKDQRITDSIRSFNPDSQGAYDKVTLEYQDVRSGQWYKEHRGFVRGVSGASKMGVAKMIISDPATLLSAIPFSKKYEDATPQKVFNDVADKFRQSSPFNPVVSGAPNRSVGAGGSSIGGDFIGNTMETISEATDALGLTNTGAEDKGNPKDVHTFHANRHTCADALNWICNITNARWYFSFGGGQGFQLNLVYDPADTPLVFLEHDLAGRGSAQENTLNNGGSFPQCPANAVDIIKNTALQEIFPLNTLTLRGETGASLFGMEASWVPSHKFPEVTISYEPFKRRAGGNVVAETIETKNVTLQSATATAINRLEKKILDSGTGTMQCYMRPNVKPYDHVIAQPECADVIETQSQPLTHEVASVRHVKDSHKEGLTYIDVSPVFNRSEVTIESAEMKDV